MIIIKCTDVQSCLGSNGSFSVRIAVLPVVADALVRIFTCEHNPTDISNSSVDGDELMNGPYDHDYSLH